MADSHNATTPYHTITTKGVGTVVGFSVGFSLGTCCRIWLGPPIHFILMPDPLHTYKRSFTCFIYAGQSYEYVLTPHVSPLVAGLGRVDFWHVSHWYVMIGSSHPLQTHTRSWHTFYEVDNHMSVSLLHYHHNSLGQVWCGWKQWYAVNLALKPLIQILSIKYILMQVVLVTLYPLSFHLPVNIIDATDNMPTNTQRTIMEKGYLWFAPQHRNGILLV